VLCRCTSEWPPGLHPSLLHSTKVACCFCRPRRCCCWYVARCAAANRARGCARARAGADIVAANSAPFYILRPETFESLFVLNQITGNPVGARWCRTRAPPLRCVPAVDIPGVGLEHDQVDRQVLPHDVRTRRVSGVWWRGAVRMRCVCVCVCTCVRVCRLCVCVPSGGASGGGGA
jgi:hypothetical protein